MGCDIHFYVEKRNGQGVWESADEWIAANPVFQDDDEPAFHIEYGKHWYSNRNYGLFAILADVRNGVGFAGCDTGDRLHPIAELRGLPDGLSENIQIVSDYDGEDGHSHSWLTLNELLEYDWTQTVVERGYIQSAVYYTWGRWARNHGEPPQEWSGDVWGACEKIDEQAMQKYITRLINEHGKDTPQLSDELSSSHFYTQVEWTQHYYAIAHTFLSNTLPRLLKLSNGDYSNVRIVFWFDN